MFDGSKRVTDCEFMALRLGTAVYAEEGESRVWSPFLT